MTPRKRLAAAAAAGLAALLVLTGCATNYTSPSMVALRYSGGLGEGGKFKECVKPGDKQLSDDSYYPYPATQRQDLFDTTNPAADHTDLEVSSADGQTVYVRVNVNFGLNTDCDTLRKFHEVIGETRKAYFHKDGTYGTGWTNTMNYYISPAVVSGFRAAVAKYDLADLWPSTKNLPAIQNEVQAGLQASVDKLTEGDEEFFNRLSVDVYAINPGDDYKALYTERQQAKTKAETAEANKKAQITQAQADGAVKVAQAKADAAAARQAIRAFKLPGMTMAQAVRAYNESQAIAAGINPFQPTGSVLASAGQ